MLTPMAAGCFRAAVLWESPVKVLLLADSLANGGLERQLSLLATNLPPDWEPRVWAMAGGPFEAYLRSRGVTVRCRSGISAAIRFPHGRCITSSGRGVPTWSTRGAGCPHWRRRLCAVRSGSRW